MLALRPPGAADVEPARPTGGALAACRSLVAALPQTLDGAERREVDPDVGTTAAWGDPAIVLRCGTAAPDPVTVQCVGVDGVDWAFLARGSGGSEGHGTHEEGAARTGPDLGYAFRTYGREPVVEIVVPPEHAPEAEVLVPLAPLVGRLPTTDLRCLAGGS